MTIKDFIDFWVRSYAFSPIGLSTNDLRNWVEEKLEELQEKYHDLFRRDTSVNGNCDFIVNCDGLLFGKNELVVYEKRMRNLSDRVEHIKLSGATYWGINVTISNIGRNMKEYTQGLQQLQNALVQIKTQYQKSEKVISSNLQTI